MISRNIKNGEIPITLVDSPRQLITLAAHLNTLKELAFDTEFDRFYRQYGFNLQLIQIFDGKSCYLVDAVRIRQLDPLWSVFENESIRKVLFSGREDIDLLKRNGCNPVNLFDVQIAAVLCNKPEQSYINLVKNELAIALDKSAQRSNWEIRPMTIKQLIYASNDVIYLLSLKDRLLDECIQNNLTHFLDEENSILASSSTTDYSPKLSSKQKKEFGEYSAKKLLEFKLLTDRFGKAFNRPPHNIVGDAFLEEIIRDKSSFLKDPFAKGFSKTAVESASFTSEFLELVQSIDISIPWKNKKGRNSLPGNNRETPFRFRNGKDPNYLAFKEYVVHRYGDIAASLILGGVSERFTDEGIDWAGSKKYQEPLYREFITASPRS